MQHEPRFRLPNLAGLILFLLAAVAIWVALERSQPRSDWLRVEAPPQALAGRPLRLRIYVAPLPESGVLGADLHWGTSRDGPMQYLGSGGPKAVGKEGGVFEYDIVVPRREGLRYVMGVIFWGPSGDWSSHRLAASTKLIPVASDPAAVTLGRLQPLALQAPSDPSPDHSHPAASPRWLTGLLFLAAMIGAARANQSVGSQPASAWDIRFWRLMVVVLALAFLWELLGLENWVGARARTLARAGDLYYPRDVFQKIFISVALAGTLLCLGLIARARTSRRLLLVSVLTYAAIAMVNLVSLHEIDRIAGLSWHGLTVVQTLKLLCAGLTVYALREPLAGLKASQALP